MFDMILEGKDGLMLMTGPNGVRVLVMQSKARPESCVVSVSAGDRKTVNLVLEALKKEYPFSEFALPVQKTPEGTWAAYGRVRACPQQEGARYVQI